jgi:hypothetical protein
MMFSTKEMRSNTPPNEWVQYISQPQFVDLKSQGSKWSKNFWVQSQSNEPKSMLGDCQKLNKNYNLVRYNFCGATLMPC